MINNFTPTFAQFNICRKYQSKIIPYADDERVAIALSCLGKQPIYGARIYPRSDEPISWFFYCGEYSDATDFYQLIHLCHAIKLMPEIESYLCLDYGYKIIIDKSGYEDVWREQQSSL